jgi:hypothetical protein
VFTTSEACAAASKMKGLQIAATKTKSSYVPRRYVMHATPHTNSDSTECLYSYDESSDSSDSSESFDNLQFNMQVTSVNSDMYSPTNSLSHGDDHGHVCSYV